MTLSHAYKLLNLVIKNKQEKKNGLLDPTKSWNSDDSLIKDLAIEIAGFLDNDIEWLQAIKKQLPRVPKCKHPKRLHDRCGGKLYCMGCNQDLE